VIHIIRARATPAEMEELLEMLKSYVKLAVDIDRKILAGGGIMYADCKAVLLQDGSQQEFIWGADWNPSTQQVTFEALINIRPRQGNPSMDILDPSIRKAVAEVTANRLSGL
jgi:hypothetical protein